MTSWPSRICNYLWPVKRVNDICTGAAGRKRETNANVWQRPRRRMQQQTHWIGFQVLAKPSLDGTCASSFHSFQRERDSNAFLVNNSHRGLLLRICPWGMLLGERRLKISHEWFHQRGILWFDQLKVLKILLNRGNWNSFFPSDWVISRLRKAINFPFNAHSALDLSLIEALLSLKASTFAY